jgi:hypothetical protein
MLRSSLLVLLLAYSATSYADGFDYNYIDLSYGILEFDDIDVDGDGFGIGGSVAINSDFHVFAGYQSAGLDFGVDVSQFGAGIGYNTELSPTVDAVARFSYQYVDVDAPGFSSVDDNGFGFGVGLRFAASDVLEIAAGIDFVDFDDGGDDTAFGLGAFYSFSGNFDAGLSGSWGDDVSSYLLTGRYYFGR